MIINDGSKFMRSIAETAGTVGLASGRTLRGWVTEVDDDFFFLALADPDDRPTDDLNKEGDDRTILVRIDHVETWEYAGEDDW